MKALKTLIESTQILDNNEKLYWIKKIPKMDRFSKGRLHEILSNAEQQLQELDDLYADKVLALLNNI